MFLAGKTIAWKALHLLGVGLIASCIERGKEGAAVLLCVFIILFCSFHAKAGGCADYLTAVCVGLRALACPPVIELPASC